MSNESRQTWVLLRGLMRESRHWGDFPQLLGAALGDARVVAIDLPGNGRLNDERSAMRVEAMVAACRAQLARQGVLPPYRLLALSLGAMVAVSWAERHPEDLAACVLINTSLRPFSPLHHRLRPSNWPRILRLALTAPTARAWEDTVLRLTVHAPAAHREVLTDWIAWRRERPVTRANALRQLVAAARFQAPRLAPAVPMLVLAGAGDTLVDPRCSQALARAWRLPCAVHPQAGHDLPLEDGWWVAAQVRAWCDASAAGRRTGADAI